MICFRNKNSSDFVAASMASVMIVGLIYIGVLLLNDAEQPSNFTAIEGAIRIALPQKITPEKELQRKELKETKPPERLPKTFSSKSKPKSVRPIVNISLPTFSADVNPAFKGGISMPVSKFEGIGFNMDEVDDLPQPLRSFPPKYPYNAKRNSIEGKVIVRMLVTKDGIPSEISIHSATPSGVFEKTAINAAKRWRFRPGQYKGRAVDTWVLLPFNFEMTQ